MLMEQESKFQKLIHGKNSRRLLESSVISQSKHLKQRGGFYQISANVADIILHDNNIRIENG